MEKLLRFIGMLLFFSLFGLSVRAEPLGADQVKGLDEQIQDIKSDVLSIASELNLLEEKLLYPSHSEIALFLAIEPEDEFRLDSVSLLLDGHQVADHIYSFKELEAMQRGGVQKIYTGNVKSGAHNLTVLYRGESKAGHPFEKELQFSLKKGIGPSIGEIVLNQQTAVYSDR